MTGSSSSPRARRALRALLATPLSWIDTHAVEIPADGEPATNGADAKRVDWSRIIPFVLLHVAVVAVVWVGISWTALILCLGAYALRMFGITAFYHRYFSHRAFRTSRAFQFVGALIGNAAGQRGPLWWAAHHRKHHKHADTDRDVHSPDRDGLLWCHMGWWTDRRRFATDLAQVPDFARYPELVWLDRFDMVAPVAFALGMFGLGAALETWAPSLGVDAWQAVVWGFVVSTVLLYHATFTINSLCHRFGSRRYATKDSSRNNPWLAMLTFGEGWHNNHHHYPVAARQGFFWWEVDATYYALLILSRMGLVSKLRAVPATVKHQGSADLPRRGAA